MVNSSWVVVGVVAGALLSAIIVAHAGWALQWNAPRVRWKRRVSQLMGQANIWRGSGLERGMRRVKRGFVRLRMEMSERWWMVLRPAVTWPVYRLRRRIRSRREPLERSTIKRNGYAQEEENERPRPLQPMVRWTERVG